MSEYVLVLLVTAAVTYLLTPLVRRVAVATGTMHAPRARDTHTKPTPLLGGLAMYGGLVAGLLVASQLSSLQDPFQAAGSRTAAGLLLAGGFVVVIGFVDDRWGLNAISKLAAQVAAAGILVWSGQALPWLPMPNGGVFTLEADLSVTLTILLVVVTINAINFIDGLDGLAAGIVAVAALSFLAYSYTLIRTIGSTQGQSLPAVASALLAGMCIGFLPHNFFPARIFMGDIGAMLLGLLLAYGPISSTASLQPSLLTNYSDHHHTLDRFPTFLPLLVPAAIFVIPYADLMFAIIRRTRAGKPLMVADRQHLHHRLMNIGHSYRKSVLLMYLWAALFSVAVVSLSLVRSPLIVFAAATLVAVLALLAATMPRLRPWRPLAHRKAALAAASRAAAAAVPVAPAAAGYPRAAPAGALPADARPPGPAFNSGSAPRYPGHPYSVAAPAFPRDPLPRAGRLPNADPFAPSPPQDRSTGAAPRPDQDRLPPPAPLPDGHRSPAPAPLPDRDRFTGPAPFPDWDRLQGPAPIPDGGRFPGPAPFSDQGRVHGPASAPFQNGDGFPGPAPFPPQAPFSGTVPVPGTAPVPGAAPVPGTAPVPGASPVPGAGPLADGPAEGSDSFSQAQRPDAQPR